MASPVLFLALRHSSLAALGEIVPRNFDQSRLHLYEFDIVILK